MPQVLLESHFGLDDCATHIVATVGTCYVCWRRLAALGATLQLPSGDAIVRTALAATRVGVFSFRNGHRFTREQSRLGNPAA